MLKKILKKLNFAAGASIMAMATIVASTASTQCCLMFLDDIEVPESMQIKE